MAVKFDCTACGLEYEGDIISRGASDCRQCFCIGCNQCLDEKGNCVPCDGESKEMI